MIDTIVLTLNEASFQIFKHDKFSPSTDGLYSSYYRLGGRSNLICKQNPTPAELAAGIYKPRLSVTKRINKHRRLEITLKIEFSIPKLLFGNNFDELKDTDFAQAVTKLHQSLNDMGVHVTKPVLIKAPVSAIHFSKNIPLIDYSTPYAYLEQLSKINLNQRLDLNQTDFRNEGHSLKFRANSFEIAFYDKMKDLQKAKTSDKRAEEKENSIQLNLFDTVLTCKPFEVLRMEVRLNKRQKLKHTLKCVGVNAEPTFQNVFKSAIARKVLLYYMTEIERSYPAILLYNNKDHKDFISDLIIHNPKLGMRKALQMLGARILIDEVGVREFREVTRTYGKANWYRLNKEMLSLHYPQNTNSLAVIRACLEDHKPLKLADYKKKRRKTAHRPAIAFWG